MKKITYLFFALILSATGLHGQNFYFKTGLGYAFAMPGEKLDQNGNVLNGVVNHTSAGVTDYELKNASFTSGVPLAIGVGLTLSKNIAIELSTSINLAPVKYSEGILNETNSSGQVFSYYADRQAKNTVILMPSVVLQTDNKTWNMYMRMGLALPLNTGLTLYETYMPQSGGAYSYTWSIQNYFSLGFTAAAGLELKVSNKFAVWGEISMLYLNISREERDLNTAVINGSSYPVSQLTGITKYHYNQNGISDSNGNEQALSQPYSNLGINVGISYIFNNHSEKKKHSKKKN